MSFCSRRPLSRKSILPESGCAGAGYIGKCRARVEALVEYSLISLPFSDESYPHQ